MLSKLDQNASLFVSVKRKKGGGGEPSCPWGTFRRKNFSIPWRGTKLAWEKEGKSAGIWGAFTHKLRCQPKKFVTALRRKARVANSRKGLLSFERRGALLLAGREEGLSG